MGDHHIHDNGKHVEEIDARLRKLAAAFSDAGSSDDFEELFIIIHRPGWTTLPEVALLNSLIDVAEQTVAAAVQVRGAILAGALAIAEGSAVAV
jgi:hypothetical protein